MANRYTGGYQFFSSCKRGHVNVCEESENETFGLIKPNHDADIGNYIIVSVSAHPDKFYNTYTGQPGFPQASILGL